MIAVHEVESDFLPADASQIFSRLISGQILWFYAARVREKLPNTWPTVIGLSLFCVLRKLSPLRNESYDHHRIGRTSRITAHVRLKL